MADGRSIDRAGTRAGSSASGCGLWGRFDACRVAALFNEFFVYS
jgi:hypothetical protein